MENEIKEKIERCSICGKPTSLMVCDDYVCEECYYEYGSCCLEFGGHDLWKEEDNSW